MDYKQFKDLNISRLGYGCMRFPKIEGSDTAIDEEKAQALLDEAYEKGINYFDVAYPYHGKTAEKFVGKAMRKYPRDSFFLATKMPFFSKLSLEESKAIFKEQLENLRTDYFDFYLLHAMNRDRFENTKEIGLYDYLISLKKEGKIKYLGFSFHDSPDVLEEIVNTYDFDFVQIQLNYVDWVLQNAQKEYEILSSRKLPIMVMEPVRGGALSKLPQEAEAVFKAVRPEASNASWALRFVASLNSVQVVLSGMSDKSQLEDNLATFSNMKPLAKEEEAAVAKVRDIFIDKHTVPCTACNYCQPCPAGIKIPSLFSLWNKYVLTREKDEFVKSYQALEEPGSVCLNCKKCLSLCPQQINIPNRIKEIDRSAACMSV